jgi:hypothetical protein
MACGALLRVSPAEVLRAPPPPVEAPLSVAWERDAGSLAQRFFLTHAQLARGAAQFFASLEDKPARRAELFAYVCSLIGLMGYFAVQLFFLRDVDSARLVEIIARATDRPVRPDGVLRFFAWGFALSPLLAALPSHVCAGLYQLGLWSFRAGSHPYELTFRVVSYGLAPMVLLIVPAIGPFLALAWIFALHLEGISTAHRLPPIASLLVILMPALSVGLLLLRGFGYAILLVMTR